MNQINTEELIQWLQSCPSRTLWVRQKLGLSEAAVDAALIFFLNHPTNNMARIKWLKDRQKEFRHFKARQITLKSEVDALIQSDRLPPDFSWESCGLNPIDKVSISSHLVWYETKLRIEIRKYEDQKANLVSVTE